MITKEIKGFECSGDGGLEDRGNWRIVRLEEMKIVM